MNNKEFLQFSSMTLFLSGIGFAIGAYQTGSSPLGALSIFLIVFSMGFGAASTENDW